MAVIGIDAHNRNHTAVAVDDAGCKLGEHSCGTTSVGHRKLLAWSERFLRL